MEEAVVGTSAVGLGVKHDQLLGMAEFVKLFPKGPSETVFAGYCAAVTSYYSAVAELARERLGCTSVVASSVETHAVKEVAQVERLSDTTVSEGDSVSVGSSASTGKQARKARRRLKKEKSKAGLDVDKRLRMSSSDWRTNSPITKSEASSVSTGASAVSACVDELEGETVMRRKYDTVSFRGQGFCYLYAVRDCAMTQMAQELGPDPLFSDLLAQPAEQFESIGCLAALRVDLSSGSGHIVPSVRSGLTRFWTLCCSVNWREYSPGSLGFSTRRFIACSASFVREAGFRLGASDRLRGGVVTSVGLKSCLDPVDGFHEYWAAAGDGLAVASMNFSTCSAYAANPMGRCDFEPGVVGDTGWQDFRMTEVCRSWSWFRVPAGVAVWASGFRVMAQDKPFPVVLLPGAELTLSKRVATRAQVVSALPPGARWTTDLTDKFGSKQSLSLERMLCGSTGDASWEKYTKQLGLTGHRSEFVSGCDACILSAPKISGEHSQVAEARTVELSETYDDSKAIRTFRHYLSPGVHTMKSFCTGSSLTVLYGYKAYQRIASVELAGVVKLSYATGCLAVDFSQVAPVVKVEDVDSAECSITTQSIIDPYAYDYGSR